MAEDIFKTYSEYNKNNMENETEYTNGNISVLPEIAVRNEENSETYKTIKDEVQKNSSDKASRDDGENSSQTSMGNDVENTSAVSNEAIIAPVIIPPQQPKFKYVLEVGAFMYFFAISLSGSVFQSQLLYQTCRDVYHYDETTCKPFIGTTDMTDASTSVEDEIQVYVSKIVMASSIINGVVSAILALFIGPWSDKFGRRQIIFTISIAYFLDYLIFSILGFIELGTEFSPWLYLIPAIPAIFCGGKCALTSIVYAYISDSSLGRERAMRLLIAEAYLGMGLLLGNLCGGYILAATNFVTVYCISALIMAIAAVYTYFLIVESLSPSLIQSGSKLRAFFDIALVVDLFRTAFKERPRLARAIIWLTIASLIMSRFVNEGESNIVYLYFTKQFNWTLQNYNIFVTISSIVLIPGGIIGVFLLWMLFKTTLPVINMIGYGGAALQSLIRAFAQYTWEVYLGLALGFMSGVPSSMSMSILSLATPQKEIGKIFSLTTVLLTLVPLGAAPLYTLIYDATLDTYAGAFNYLSFGFSLLCFACMTGIMLIQKKYPPLFGPQNAK